MKKIVSITLLLVGLVAFAQEKRKEHQRTMNDLTPEQMATLQTKKMTLALDLNEAQQKQIQQLNFEQAEQRKAAMEERKKKRVEEDSEKPTSEERYARQLERLDKQIARKADMKKILSQEQYERWEKMMVHKERRSRKNHRGKHAKRRK